jgi:hypothetical protein
LTSTNEYKELIKRQADVSKQTKMMVLLSTQPKYFWRAILRIEGHPVMELLADATDMSRSFPIFFAVWHNQEDKTTLHKYLESHDFKEAALAALGVPFWSFIKDWS